METLSEGKYYFGDICYIMDKEVYHKVWGDELGFKDGQHNVDFVDSKGKHWVGTFAVAGTAYGDGCYQGINMAYGVDAGVLGLVPESLWDLESAAGKHDGMIFTSGSKVEYEFGDGKFKVRSKNFNEEVDTGEENDEDEEDYYGKDSEDEED